MRRNITDPGIGCRLNLGCGSDVKPGYVNVDFRPTHPNVIPADLSELPWPFADGCAKEVLLYDFLEHLSWRLTDRVLLECFRILEPTGELVIQVPDGDQLANALTQDGWYMCNRCEMPMGEYDLNGWERHDPCRNCGQTADEVSQQAVQRLYGGQDYVGNTHLTTFTAQSLEAKLKRAGFGPPLWEEAEHQSRQWNMKARFTRTGDIW